MIEPVVQEHDYGCGVACLANIRNISYQEALKYFDNGEHKAATEGFYLKEMCLALAHAGVDAYWLEHQLAASFPDYRKLYTIAFVKRSEKYPAGHYLVKERKGWYNSWVNFPEYPRKAAIEQQLPGEVEYVIFTRRYN